MSKEMIELPNKLAARLNGRTVTVSPGLREEIEMAVTALRASAVAEPVAWRVRYQDQQSWMLRATKPAYASDPDIVCDPLYAHPAPAAPVPASVREALEEIASWKHDTLGQRPREPGYWATEKELNAFDRGVRMAFYRCSDRASAALASLQVPEAAPSNAPYYHAWLEVIDLCNKLKDENYALRNAAAPTREEIAMIIYGPICDATKSEHSVMMEGRYAFCTQCGETITKPQISKVEAENKADAILALKSAPAK